MTSLCPARHGMREPTDGLAQGATTLAESLRDAFLLVSGDLDRTVGQSAFAFEYVENSGNLAMNVNPPFFRMRRWRPEQPYQRTLYLPVVRQGKQPEIVEIRPDAAAHGRGESDTGRSKQRVMRAGSAGGDPHSRDAGPTESSPARATSTPVARRTRGTRGRRLRKDRGIRS